MKKKQREASLLYHPDKLWGSEKEKFADVFINLNYHFDSVTKEKENYDYFGIEVEADSKPKGTKEEEASWKLFTSLKVIPFFILWTFIPISYLEKEKRLAKLSSFAIVAALGALEISFIS